MGATTFSVLVGGKTARDAFQSAAEEARYQHGHGGYTGTIAEKRDFIMLPRADLGSLSKAAIAEIDKRIAKIANSPETTWYVNEKDILRKDREAVENGDVGRMVRYAMETLWNHDDPRTYDKWGPAGCIPIGDKWLFVGWASE